MSDVENATPFAVRVMPSADREGRDILLIVVAAHFVLPAPGEEKTRWRLFPTQDPPPLADEYVGEPGQSSLRSEGQLAYVKPATDVSIWGQACAPHGRALSEMDASVRVGPCAVDLRVYGDRVWERSVTGGARPSLPAPFLTMPLLWERAYGGVAHDSTERRPAFDARNPIGCGFQTSSEAAIGKPLPNVENPRELLTRVSDRPQTVGVGPIARHWQPRVGYAGTYDEHWRRYRAPLWPMDFDERFFCGAPSYLQASPHLSGGERVLLHGLHSDGPIRFRLPTVWLMARSRFVERDVRSTPVLDGVVIDTEVMRLTMFYRASVPAPLSFIRHRETLVRILQQWEMEASR